MPRPPMTMCLIISSRYSGIIHLILSVGYCRSAQVGLRTHGPGVPAMSWKLIIIIIMKFKFKIQGYQTEAVNNTTSVFTGQPNRDPAHYRHSPPLSKRVAALRKAVSYTPSAMSLPPAVLSTIDVIAANRCKDTSGVETPKTVAFPQ